MLKKFMFTTLCLLVCSAAFGQEAFPVGELKFHKIFGSRLGDKTTYSLLGTGFFRTLSSGEEDSLIKDWVGRHPQAKALPVTIIGEGSTRPMVYVWVIDGSENMNLFLVENGAFSGSVMFDAVQFMRARAPAEGRAAGTGQGDRTLSVENDGAQRRFVSDASYDAFVEKLEIAEETARKHKAGIWADKFKELREE